MDCIEDEGASVHFLYQVSSTQRITFKGRPDRESLAEICAIKEVLLLVELSVGIWNHSFGGHRRCRR